MPERLWWQRGVVYQIYPRSFRDTNGDGIGDLPGVVASLPYLGDTVGVDAIWLSPFYPSPMADFGYDVADYCDVDPMFGTLDDFDRLVAEAHARDIHVIVDFVPNHSSDRHPWFLDSRSSRTSPRREWYIWRDAKPDGSPPNNWQSVFGGDAWEWDEATGQYYLHLFLKEQPDLNWRNPEVKNAMFDVVRFWLDRGVDGFRIDVAHMIMKTPGLPDNPPNPEGGLRPFDRQLHVYDMAHPDVHGVYRDLRALLDGYSAQAPRMMVGEIHNYEWPVWAEYYGAQLDEFHLPFNFGLIHVGWEAAAIRSVVDGVEGALRTLGGWPNYVLGNHDTHRIATRAGRPAARVAMMLLLTLRGTPTLYYGDELGMEDVPVPPELIQDPYEILTPGMGHGRDPERSPMQWDAGPNAGFTAPEATPWLPVAPDYREVNVAVQGDDPHSMLTLTRRLLSLRRGAAALHSGSYTPVEVAAPDCLVYERSHGDERYLIALNLGDEPQVLPIRFGSGTVLISTGLAREGQEDLSAFPLGANEGCVIRLDPRA